MDSEKIKHLLYSLGVPDNHALFEDCCQEAALALLETRRGEGNRFQWDRARSRALDYLRRERREKRIERRMREGAAAFIASR